MEKTYLFYDTEATGLIGAFDQIVQYSAIRTNTALEPIEEFDLKIKLRPDVIPSPEAQITHGFSIKRVLAFGECEYEAAKKIHSVLNKPGTISLGYNTMHFDVEMLRFMFYRNLLDPYSHQYKNGCKQMDVLPMLVFCYLYKKELFKWPVVDGRVSFKLQNIANENGLWSKNDRAHDALSDTRAAIGVFKKILEDNTLCNYLFGFFDCNTDTNRMNKFPVVLNSEISEMSRIGHTFGLHLNPKYQDSNCQAAVLCLGSSIAYPKQSLWLIVDNQELQSMTINNFRDKAHIVRKKSGDSTFVVPGTGKFCRLPAEKISLATKNLEWLKNQPALFEAIVRYFREYRYPCPTNDMDPDAALYGGPFMTDRERMYCNRFHDAETIEDKLGIEFPRPVHNELANRIVWRNFKNSNAGKSLQSYASNMKSFINNNPVYDHNGRQRLTPKEALVQIGVIKMENDLNSKQIRSLEELEGYIKSMFLCDTDFTDVKQESLVAFKDKYFNIIARLLSAFNQANSIRQPV